MHPLSKSLSEALLQNGVQVTLEGMSGSEPEKAIVVSHDKREQLVTLRRKSGECTEVQLDQTPFRIAVSNETAIQCRYIIVFCVGALCLPQSPHYVLCVKSELVGHKVELADENGEYNLAKVRQASVNVAANLLRFASSGGKEWVDMVRCFPIF